MAKPTLVPLLRGAGIALLLVLGGCGGAPGEAGQVEAGQVGADAEPADEGAPPDDDAADDVADDSGDGGDDGERPGQPGAEVSTGDSGARPGVPFDQPIFQDRGRPFDADARQSLEDRCADVCSVAYSVDGDPDDPSLACRISAFSYEPAEEGRFFQAGSTVTVHLTCTERETTEGGTTDDGTTEDGTTDDGTTEDGTTEDGTTEDGTTEDGTTEDAATEDAATEDGTTDDGTPEDPAG